MLAPANELMTSLPGGTWIQVGLMRFEQSIAAAGARFGGWGRTRAAFRGHRVPTAGARLLEYAAMQGGSQIINAPAGAVIDVPISKAKGVSHCNTVGYSPHAAAIAYINVL